MSMLYNITLAMHVINEEADTELEAPHLYVRGPPHILHVHCEYFTIEYVVDAFEYILFIVLCPF